MTARASLPNRRQSFTVPFRHGPVKYFGTWSCFGDQLRPDRARPAEVFLQGGKNGSGVQALARDAAVAVSLALQFGTPLKILREAMTRNDDGLPAGPMGRLLDVIAEDPQ
jgi:hypothetical protein